MISACYLQFYCIVGFAIKKLFITTLLDPTHVVKCDFLYIPQAVSVAPPPHGYQAPPPGYPVYTGAPPPTHVPPPHVRAMPPAAPGYPAAGHQYYTQPPPAAAG